MELTELLIDDLDDGCCDNVSLKDASIDSSLYAVANKQSCHCISVPTCDCDYIKWVSGRDKIKLPDFFHGLKPTKIDQNGQCIYCKYYACWKKIDLLVFESTEMPFWTKPEWYNKPDENE